MIEFGAGGQITQAAETAAAGGPAAVGPAAVVPVAEGEAAAEPAEEGAAAAAPTETPAGAQPAQPSVSLDCQTKEGSNIEGQCSLRRPCSVILSRC